MISLEREIRQLIANVVSNYPSDEKPVVSICLQQGSASVLAIDDEYIHKTASLMKVPIMGAVYQLVDDGEIDPQDALPVQNSFPSMASHGQLFSIDAVEDSDSQIYELIGQTLPVIDLVEKMITLSSNLATNIVFTRVGPQAVAAFISSAGARKTLVPRGIEDMEALKQGEGNRTTARDMAAILTSIWEGNVVSRDSRQEMLGHLARQTWNDELPARLPSGVQVMHKTGWLNGLLHDAAIIAPKVGPAFTLAVLSDGWRDDHVAQHVLQEIGLAAYNYMTRL